MITFRTEANGFNIKMGRMVEKTSERLYCSEEVVAVVVAAAAVDDDES